MPKPAPRAGVKRALDQHQLTVFYQPIHELESRRIIAAEALLRARRESGEIRAAGPIAAGAEKSADLFRFDSWLVQHAYSDAVHWQTDGAPDVRLNVNLSAREFQEGDVLRRLTAPMTRSGIDTKTINLEITETASIECTTETMHNFAALKDLGIQLWLDDFGTEHSSIAHLLQFPADGLKVPGEFVKAIPWNRRAITIVRSIVTLAHELEVKVIAEGVENDGQLDMLRDMRCDFVQGFLFSEPMPLQDFEELLKRQTSNAKRQNGDFDV